LLEEEADVLLHGSERGVAEPFADFPLGRRDAAPLAVFADEVDDLFLTFRERDLLYFIRQNSLFSEFYLARFPSQSRRKSAASQGRGSLVRCVASMRDGPGARVLDLLVIGAGPVGLACALEAKRQGLSHVVVEKGALLETLR